MTRKRAPGPRRGTAVSSKGVDRANAILDAAVFLLASEGAGALSLRRVATEIGIAVGNLQYYFPTRGHLVRALLERVMKQAVADLEARFTAERRTLASLCDALLEEHSNPVTCRLFFELWALAARDEEVAMPMRQFYDTFTEAVARALRVEHPSVSEGDASRRARLFVAGLEGLSLFRSGATGQPNAKLDADCKRWLLSTLKT